MYGIPHMKLHKIVVLRRIETLKTVGIELVAHTEVGKDISADERLQTFDRVIVCTGARQARELPVPGRERCGIVLAVDFRLTDTLTD